MAEPTLHVLFVDDEPAFLDTVQRLMAEYAGAAWQIHTATDTAQALGVLQEHKIDLLVTDIHMPVVDGLQFLKLLQRKYRDMPKVVLTGDTTGAFRAPCLSNGAELYLEKPRAAGGWQAIYANLRELAKLRPAPGFRGVVKSVGLQDILQLECLARNSSVLEVRAEGMQGLIFIAEGQVVHAEAGAKSGEQAFALLMSYGSGEFNLRPFTEPTQRSIRTSWEFLLLEAARKHDETPPPAPPGGSPPDELATLAAITEQEPEAGALASVTPERHAFPLPGAPSLGLRPSVEEFLICTTQGQILHEWQCANASARTDFLEFLSQKASLLTQALPVGDFDRLECQGPEARVVARIRSSYAFFLRLRQVLAEPRPATAL